MRHASALCLLALSHCTVAQFAGSTDGGRCGEAGCSSDTAPDGLAGPQADPTPVEATAEQTEQALLGTYAVHARFYGTSTSLVLSLHENIVIAEISRAADRSLTMRVTTCLDGGQLILASGVSQNVEVLHPERFPVREFGLVVQGETFYTTGSALTIGYTKDPPDACTAGAQIPSDEPWRPGKTCRCVFGDEPPNVPEDCRIIDSDGDGNPGMTVVSRGLINDMHFARIHDSSQYVAGVADPITKRHRANYKKEEDYWQVVCFGPCPAQGLQWCPLPLQPVSFVPLDPQRSEATCSDVLRRVSEGELFPEERLDGSFPSGC